MIAMGDKVINQYSQKGVVKLHGGYSDYAFQVLFAGKLECVNKDGTTPFSKHVWQKIK